MEMKKLNPKIKRFIEAYEGNVVEAMQMAGYEGGEEFLRARGIELLAQRPIMEAVQEKSRIMASTIRMIASKEELQGWWTNLVRNNDPHASPGVDRDGISESPDVPLSTRIKASEMLAKTHGAFIDKIDISGTVTISQIIQDAYMVEEDIDAIEAEYIEARAKKTAAITGRAETPFSAAPNEDDDLGDLI